MKKGFGIIKILSSLMIGFLGGFFLSNNLKNKKIEKESNKVLKFKRYYYTLNQLFIIKQEGKALSEYFVKNGYKTISIYGMGEMGSRLLDELKNTEISVKYGVDKNAGSSAELDVFDLEDNLEKVDVIVVTAIFAFEEIEKELSQVMDCPIISLEDVIFDL